MTPSDIADAWIGEAPILFASAVLALFVSLIWMQTAVRLFRIRMPTIPAVFYFTYLMMIFMPSFWVYLDHPGTARDSFMVGVISVLFTIPAGITLINWITRFTPKETAAYFRRAPAPLEDESGQSFAHFWIIVATFSLVAIYFITVPVVPLLELIRNPGDNLALAIAREESFKLLDPRWDSESSTDLFYAYLFLRTLLFPVIIVTTLGIALQIRSFKKWVWFSLVLIVGGIYAMSSLSRAPISAIFMRVFFFLYLFFQARISKKVAVAFFLLMLAFPLIVTIFANNTEFSVGDGLLAIALRLTYTPAQDLYYYFEIFPDVHEYLLGHTLIKPVLQFIGADYFYIENYVHLYISPSGIETGHANAAFISNLNADFGIVGVVVGGILTGMLIQALEVHLSRQEKTIFNMATYAFIVYAIWALNFGSITSVLIVNGVIPVFVLVWMMRSLPMFLRPLIPANARGVPIVRAAP